MTHKKRTVGILLLTCLILGGWSQPTDFVGNDPLTKKVDQLHQLVRQKQWKAAATEADQLENLYQKSKWKLQVLGDEAEYEGVEQEIIKLISAVEMRDSAQAKQRLATLRAILKAIYTM